jgi:hypothetical protein
MNNIINDGITIDNNDVLINVDKVQMFRGIEIHYKGDIKISCAWCNRINDTERIAVSKNSWSKSKGGFVLGADNTSGKIIIFSLNPDKNSRIMNVNNLQNGKLFSFTNYGKEKFEIEKAILADESDEYKILYPTRNGLIYKYNKSNWSDLKEGSPDWQDLVDKDEYIENNIEIGRIKTGWELNERKSSHPKKINPRKVTSTKMNNNRSSGGGY